MPRKIYRIAFLLLVLVSVGGPGLAEQLMTAKHVPKDRAVVYGLYHTGEIQLRWAVTEWPSDLLGFRFERAEMDDGAAGAFQSVGPTLWEPEVSLERAVSLGFGTTVAAIQRGDVAEIPAVVLRTSYRYLGEELPGVIRAMWRGMSLLALHGFAWMDREVKAGSTYRYRVIPVHRDGPRTPIGEASVGAVWDPPEIPVTWEEATLDYAGRPKVVWSVDGDVAEQASLRHYAVYRGPVGGPLEFIRNAGNRKRWVYALTDNDKPDDVFQFLISANLPLGG